MRPSRRGVLAAVVAAVVAGCAGPGGTVPATPPPDTFEVSIAGEHAIELRYTGIGTQDPARYRLVLEGAGAADGTYDLSTVTDDPGWSAEDRYVLNQTTLGLSAPLSVDGLSLELQYRDDGNWHTLLRVKPAD